MKTTPIHRAGSQLALGFLLTLVVGAHGSVIAPGFDLFHTPGDGSSFVDLSGVGLGDVPLEGNPALLGPGLGNTDTIVVRKDGLDPFDFNPPGPDSGTVDIELVALSLRSVDPVNLTPLGGPFIGVFSDLYITLNATQPYFDALGNPVFDGSGVLDKFPNLPQPDALPLSMGTMDLLHTNPDGLFPNDGTFTSAFPNVFADAIFTVVGGDPNNPGDIFINQPAPAIVLNSSGGWTHTLPLGDQHTEMLPAGDFYITDVIHTGPHQVLVATPEPSRALLLLLGACGGVIRRRRR